MTCYSLRSFCHSSESESSDWSSDVSSSSSESSSGRNSPTLSLSEGDDDEPSNTDRNQVNKTTRNERKMTGRKRARAKVQEPSEILEAPSRRSRRIKSKTARGDLPIDYKAFEDDSLASLNPDSRGEEKGHPAKPQGSQQKTAVVEQVAMEM